MLGTNQSRSGQDRALVGFSVSFGVHALAFGAFIAGAWLAVGSIRLPVRHSRPLLPPLFIEEPPAAAVAAPLPRSSEGARTEKKQPDPDEPIPEMVQPEIIPEVLPEMDPSEAAEADEVWEEGIPDGSTLGIPGGDRNGIIGGVRNGDPNGIVGGDRKGRGKGPGSDSEPDEALPLGGAISKPVRTHDVKPDYPEHARQARLQGSVSLEVIIDRDGRVESVRVLSGNEIFRKAAVEAVSEWRYRPALQNGTPVKVIMSIIVDFKLR